VDRPRGSGASSAYGWWDDGRQTVFPDRHPRGGAGDRGGQFGQPGRFGPWGGFGYERDRDFGGYSRERGVTSVGCYDEPWLTPGPRDAGE
jgi:hypothetical protein